VFRRFHIFDSHLVFLAILQLLRAESQAIPSINCLSEIRVFFINIYIYF
jgi:hypothetical protein